MATRVARLVMEKDGSQNLNPKPFPSHLSTSGFSFCTESSVKAVRVMKAVRVTSIRRGQFSIATCLLDIANRNHCPSASF